MQKFSFKCKYFFVAFALTGILLPDNSQSADIETGTAILRTLDKITGRTNTVNAEVGSEFEFGTLTIKVNVCKTRPPEETPENSVFLEITDNPPMGESKKIFGGWMFSSSPALSALDNPVYDIWLLKCVGKKKTAGNTPLKAAEKSQETTDEDANPIVKIDDVNPLPKEEIPAPESEEEASSWWF